MRVLACLACAVFAFELWARALPSLLPAPLSVLAQSGLQGRLGWRDDALVYGLRAPYEASYAWAGHRVTLKHVPFAAGGMLGYRADAAVEPPADLLALGDSFVYGAHVDGPDVWTQRLARARGWKIANLGALGYATIQEELAFRRFGPAFKPRRVLLFVGRADAEEDALFSRWRRLRADPANPWRDLREFTFCDQLRLGPRACAPARLFSRLGVLPKLALLIRARGRRADPAVLSEGAGLMLDSLARLRRQTRTLGAPLFVVFYDGIPPHYAPVVKALEHEKIPYLDLVKTAGPLPSIPLDRHWTAEGHAAAAKAIDRFLPAR